MASFETVYFWLNIEKYFFEVKKVIKQGRIFLIGMESNCDEKLAIKELLADYV